MTANETVKTYTDIANKGLERMTSLGELNMRMFDRLVSRQTDAVNLMMEHSNRLLKLATEAKGYNDFFKGQTEVAKDLSGLVVAESKASLAEVGELTEQYRAWFEKGLAEMNVDLRKAVPAK